jgi:ferredoxin, 2Fe-2S
MSDSTTTISEKKYDPAHPENLEPLAENMVRVVFLPEGKVMEYEHGKLPYRHHGKPASILDVAENFDVFLDHACGGNCACTTCHVVVKEGASLLNEVDDDEADRLDMAADLQLASRLGCQAVVEKPGTVVVEIPSWNRNYVSEGGASKL